MVTLLLTVALFSSTVGTLFAGTTGTISGTITDSKTGNPVASVMVNAVSPTGSYKTVTNSKGFFSFEGVSPDTYIVSFELNGYQPASFKGVTVNADQSADVSTKLTKSLSTIGSVTVRGQTGAFQPKQTQDTYTVSSNQIDTLLGAPDAVSETTLLTELPGASLDKYGYPVLRGGRENEEGFEFDGIPETDAFTSQFTNSLTLNGNASQLQLTPGAGDVSVGGAGTGSINLIAKRGTYPAFGDIVAQSTLDPYNHQVNFEYGFATPNGRLSNYFSFAGLNSYDQLGEYRTDAASIGEFFDPAFDTSRDILDNLVYKFGKDNKQSVQLLFDNQQSNFVGQYGGYGNTAFPTADPYQLAAFLEPYTGLTQQQLQTLSSLLPYQTSLTSTLAQANRGATNYYQPNNVFKVQYSNNLSSSSFITAKYYELDSVSTFDFANADEEPESLWALQGGHRDGVNIDFTTQASSKHVFQAGAEYDFLKPTYDEVDPYDGLLFTGLFGSNFELNDFVSPTATNCPITNFFGPGITNPKTGTACGYLYGYFPNGPGSIPDNEETAPFPAHTTDFYIRDKYTPNNSTVVDYGVRIEGQNNDLPAIESGCNPTVAQVANNTTPDNCLYEPTSFKSVMYNGALVSVPSVSLPSVDTKPLEFEPRAAISEQLDKNDSIRLSYARSVEFAPLAFEEDYNPPGAYSKYAGVPSYSAFTGGNADDCGVTGNLMCTSYADQLHWEFQNNVEGVPAQPVAPETFNNYELSLSHQFPAGIGVKVTPFYRRGYDALALVSEPKLINGQTVTDPATGNPILLPSTSTNLGQSRTSGVELFVTKESAYGLSGTFSATYINEFTNVIPTPLIQEDFFPPIPTQSLDLGNQYRVSFVSPLSATLALSYKTHGGIKINPIFNYTRGYPNGVGNVDAVFINGKAFNVANTNAANAATFGAQNYAPNFIDPQNPGSLLSPNIAATRGTPETSSAGGFLTNPRITTNLSVEFNPKNSRNTIGILVTNLFNEVYSGVPSYNDRYQAVATGISGPLTGQTNLGSLFPEEGFSSYNSLQSGQDPYVLSSSAVPTEVRVYYKLAL